MKAGTLKCVSAKPDRLLEEIAIEMAKYVQCGSAASVAAGYTIFHFFIWNFILQLETWEVLGKILR